MRRIKTLLLLLLLTLPLFAQGGKEKEGITITWWHSNSGVLQEATDSLVKEFNETVGKENNITVEALYQGKANDVLVKLKAVSADTNRSEYPDIVQLDATGVIDVASTDFITYIDDLAKKNNDDLKFLQENIKVSMEYKDKLIGMPFNSSAILYYYNKTLFDEKGLNPPTSIDELIAIAPELVEKDSKGNITRYAFSNIPTTYELCAFIGNQNGVSYITDMENGHLGTPTKTVFKEDGTLSFFLTKWKALYVTGALENASSGVSSSFVAGKTASYLASSSNLTTVIKNINGRFELGVAPLFKVDENNDNGVNVGGGALFAIDKDDDKRDEAIWLFLKFATSKEEQLKWSMKTGYLPVNKDTYEMDEYKEFVEENPLFKVPAEELFASSPLVRGVWIPSGYQVYYSFMSNIDKMLKENISIEKTVETMANEIDGYLRDFYATSN